MTAESMESVPSRAKRLWERRHRPILAAGLVALLLVPSACHSPRHRGQPAYALEIEQQNRVLEEQFRSGNLLGVADLYADDGALLNAQGERTEGRQEIDEYWSAIENPVDWRLEIRSISGSNQLAYELGTSHLTTRREGALHTSINDFLVLWQRAPSGEWRILLDAYWPAAR